MMATDEQSIYLYHPSHALPAVFAVLVGLSLLLHIYQNYHYRFWKVTFFMSWGGTVFTAGWIMRCISSYIPSNANLYTAQYVLIVAGPPIYSAAEYNVLGRLMNYVPMHAPLHPDRVVIFFIYLGAIVEGLTGSGATLMATAPHGYVTSQYKNGGTLLSISLVLQAVVECLFMFMVAMVHRRCARAKMLPSNVQKLCIMLYGTSTLILVRCICRAIEAFGTTTVDSCGAICRVVLYHEWYLYVFEAAPMVLYTYWINLMHPGRLLPNQHYRYLDLDGRTERLGPGWVDKRSKWETYADPFDIAARLKDQPSHEAYWLTASNWPIAEDGSFADGTATNALKQHRHSGWRKIQLVPKSHGVEQQVLNNHKGHPDSEC